MNWWPKSNVSCLRNLNCGQKSFQVMKNKTQLGFSMLLEGIAILILTIELLLPVISIASLILKSIPCILLKLPNYRIKLAIWQVHLGKWYLKFCSRHTLRNYRLSMSLIWFVYSLKRLLHSKADAFLSNDYYESDIAWMELVSPQYFSSLYLLWVVWFFPILTLQ